MTIKLLMEKYLAFLSLKGGYTDPAEFESIHVKMPHCWKSHVVAQILFLGVSTVKCQLQMHIKSQVVSNLNCVLESYIR